MWCGGSATLETAPLKRPRWPRVRCGKCGTIHYQAMPSASEIAAIYSEAWSNGDENEANGSTIAVAAGKIVKELAGGLPGDALVLDYGAGAGILSAELGRTFPGRAYAFEPYGPDRDIAGVRWSSDDAGDWTKERFTRIFLSEVIEHLPDPTGTLARLKGLLAPGGLIVITTPNARGLKARINRGSWREAQNPSHLILFTETSLDICARRAGFRGFRRSRFRVPYKQGRLAGLALAAAQMAGLDGGLRGVIYSDDIT